MCESGNCETCEEKNECCDWGNHAGKTTVCAICHKIKCTECSRVYLNNNDVDRCICDDCITKGI